MTGLLASQPAIDPDIKSEPASLEPWIANTTYLSLHLGVSETAPWGGGN
jgi:hypothetical protein